MTSALLRCYNKGCGKEFLQEDNNNDSCCHHPGDPVFHDAYKGWSCCSKKCTDFTEFLNIKGCTLSQHNSVKPPEPEKTKQSPTNADEVIEVKPLPKKPEALPRPDENQAVKRLLSSVAPSLQQALLTKKTQELKVESSGDIEIGTHCKNAGCRKTYEGECSNLDTCIYHAGVPVFHEGLKFWTCCQRKTTDFNNFLEQAGCRTGFHLWTKAEEESKKVSCRNDWHQTDSFVYVSIYAKGVDPEKSLIDANPVKLRLLLHLSNGNIYEDQLVLFGVVDVDKSSVTFAATKVEIKLKKADILSWKHLTVAPKAE